jgi:hypothetical protein
MRQRCLPRVPVLALELALALWKLASPDQEGAARADLVIGPASVGGNPAVQIAFVTSATFTAQSADVGTYNALVQTAAAAAGLDVINGQPVTWTAIVTTPSVNARDNAPQTLPVYDLQGHLITAAALGLWNAASTPLASPIRVSESGDDLSGSGITRVWTGSRSDGTYQIGLGMGSPVVSLGDLTATSSAWLSTSGQLSSFRFHLYALSSPIIVVVAEPGSLGLLASGVAIAVAALRLRPTNAPPPPPAPPGSPAPSASSAGSSGTSPPAASAPPPPPPPIAPASPAEATAPAASLAGRP